jgi:hypothetical protein
MTISGTIVLESIANHMIISFTERKEKKEEAQGNRKVHQSKRKKDLIFYEQL